MTHEEKDDLVRILSVPAWDTRKKAIEYVTRITPVANDAPKAPDAPKRTLSQHSAMFLWFSQIEHICAEQGVTWNMMMKHTVDVAITKEGIHNFWKVLQKALFRTTSTKDLKKTGQINRMIDHFVLFFAKEGVELPPFPEDALKNNIRLNQVSNLDNENYPEYTGPTTL